ncbi:MAG: hypothetical protein U1B80_04055 [Anaerolineaceae bacterium]|nr:hypothetical protein [Anaerolineaceae bacterium]
MSARDAPGTQAALAFPHRNPSGKELALVLSGSFIRFHLVAALLTFSFLLGACGEQPTTPSGSAIPVTDTTYPTDNAFASVLNQLGGPAIFGQPLTDVILLENGEMEQLYENVIVFSPASNPNAIQFRPLPKILEMPASPPDARQYDRRDNLIFYPVEDDLGFHVPVFFDEFLSQHGGKELSGNPINNVVGLRLSGEDVARQCFENFCLDYFPNAPLGQRIRLAPLGVLYLGRMDKAISQSKAIPKSQTLILQVGEEKSELRPGEEQTIYVLIIKRQNKKPVAQVKTTIELMLPNGKIFTYTAEPSGPDGWTRITIPPLPKTKHGMMVAYKVCLLNPVKAGDCATGSYLIWDD